MASRRSGDQGRPPLGSLLRGPWSEKLEVLPRGVGTLRHLLILGESYACPVPICAVAARWFDNPHQKSGS